MLHVFGLWVHLRIFYLLLVLSKLVMMCLHVVFSIVLVLAAHGAPWKCGFLVISKFELFFFKYFFFLVLPPPTVFFLRTLNNTYVRLLEAVSELTHAVSISQILFLASAFYFT